MQLDLLEVGSSKHNIEFEGGGGWSLTMEALQLPTQLRTHFELHFIFRHRYPRWGADSD